MQDQLDSDKEEGKYRALDDLEKKIMYGEETKTLKPNEPNVEEKPKMDFDHPDFLKPYRLDTETQYQYRVRRLLGQMYTKSKKKGQPIWISKDIRQPVFDKEDTKMEGNPIGYQVSRGFTYNKEKVQAALDKYLKAKEEQQIAETETTKVTKTTE